MLAGEPNDPRSNFTVDRRSTSSSSVRPPFRHETSVPTQQRRGVTSNDTHLTLGKVRAAAAKNHGSADRNVGRLT
jgi:hypothetical protein